MLEIQTKAQRDSLKNAKAKNAQLKSLEDDIPTVRASIVFTADQHRRYKIYLANEGKKMKDDIMGYIENVIKDIP